MGIEIAALHVYPIKSCAGLSLREVRVQPVGFADDRRWMLVDADGGFLTQREYPAMATIQPTVFEDHLRVTAAGVDDLVAPFARDAGDVRDTRTATVWKFTGVAEDEGDAAAMWFSDRLGVGCRLVRTGTIWDRPVNPKYAQPEDRVGFADGYPVLMATEESLADINGRLETPIPMDRFRPNLVLRGCGAAWAEDGWRTLTLPSTGLRFRAAKASARCAMTTIDQRTGRPTGPEPLTILSRLRRGEEGKVLFGVNLIPEGPGVLRVGDAIVAE